jgi:diguanylate cyclase (GGDEF)-like protein
MFQLITLGAGMFRLPTAWLAGYSLKARLYSVIVFLGLLPVLGVLLALAAFESARTDHVALDRASRGTIHLKHINGLVYAIVMESRGIYMSPDWRAAEPFAQKLTVQLAELQQTAAAWKAEPIVGQRANVEELSKRIDHFARFRAELVRLCKEESTAAARAFGDNDANRTVRSALNESLTALARAYEEESDRARLQIDTNDRHVLMALFALAALAALALAGGVTLVKSALLTPLLGMKRSMLQLAEGDLHVPVSGTERTDEIGEMARSVQVFLATSLERQKLNREARLLSQLNEWLQSCKSLDELYQMVAEFLSRLLPDCAGSLYIYANSRDVLDSAKAWNGGQTTTAMHPDDCWGLRRGRTYTFGDNEIDFPCTHVGATVPGSYCCIPILAHGETIGLLHLAFRTSEGESQTRDEQRRLALVCAEQISLAIANAKLRDQLRDQSIRDALTGMFNRRYMLETCRREFSRAARGGQGVSILSMDIDHFKKFNDNHGHDAGDTVLRAVADCLKANFRDEDVACRFGGEEFVVILPGTVAEVAVRKADEVRAKIESLVVRYVDANLPRITISIGVAAFPQAGDNPQAVLKAADDALYRAKDGGRNRVELSPTGTTVSSPVASVASIQRALAVSVTRETAPTADAA